MTATVSAPGTFYIFRWDRRGRRGERGLVLARGTNAKGAATADRPALAAIRR